MLNLLLYSVAESEKNFQGAKLIYIYIYIYEVLLGTRARHGSLKS